MPSLQKKSICLPLLITLCLGALVASSAAVMGQETSLSNRHALLIGVTKYQHARMNEPQLEYPEADAEAVGALLRKGGYEVEMLLGEQANQANIQTRLKSLDRVSNSDGVVLIGLFGHGIEVSSSRDAYFCPHDTRMQEVTAGGKALFDNNGQPLTEPNPESLISMAEILRSLRLSPAGSKVLIADCCRSEPNRARGRAFGTKLTLTDLPENTAALFACSANEQAFESKDWQHGAFTKCLLDEIESLSKSGDLNLGSLSFRVKARVSSLVSSNFNIDTKQTPYLLIQGSPELQLSMQQIKKQTSPAIFDFSGGTQSSLAALKSQRAWAQYHGIEVERQNSVGMRLRLLPPGAFIMGTNDSSLDLHARGMSTYEGFSMKGEQPSRLRQFEQAMYMGVHEVTLGQFLKYYHDSPSKNMTEGEKDQEGGIGFDGVSFTQRPRFTPWNTGWNNPIEQFMSHPVVNVSWNDANAFCAWLTEKERKLGRITEGEVYRLPSEREWEYAARAGNPGMFGFGDNWEDLAKYANVCDLTMQARLPGFVGIKNAVLEKRDGYVFTAPVGKFLENSFGLHDMHGNVAEWCSNTTTPELSEKELLDPGIKENYSRGVLLAAIRGGSWLYAPVDSRSSHRSGLFTSHREMTLGFRVVLLPLELNQR